MAFQIRTYEGEHGAVAHLFEEHRVKGAVRYSQVPVCVFAPTADEARAKLEAHVAAEMEKAARAQAGKEARARGRRAQAAAPAFADAEFE